MAKKLSRYLPAIRLGAVVDAKMPLAGTISPAYSPVSYYEYVSVPLTASSATQTAFVASNDNTTWQVAAVSSRFGTASSSGAIQVEVAGAGVAAGSGTNQLTGTVSLAGTANTTANGTMIASPTAIAAGSAVNIVVSGTMTSLANCNVTIVLQRLS